MKIIHICSDYAQQSLYSSLFAEIQSHSIEQFIYVPVRTKEELGVNDLNNLQDTNVKYENILKKYHRIFYNFKIKTVYNKLLLSGSLENTNLIHAHFLFSDGGVALKAWYDKKIPYIVSVRNTDVYYFFRFMPHLKKKGIEILLQAKAIIFVTPSYKNLVFNKYVPKVLRDQLEKKTYILPNGIGEFWFHYKSQTPKERKDELKLLYVGDFSPNKNIKSIIKAVKLIRIHNINACLTIVGGGGKASKTTEVYIKKNKASWLKCTGIIKDKNQLLVYYSSHDIFVMPSFQETFGLVFIEALSQGMPIIYSANQGVDGYFQKSPVGHSTNPRDCNDIKDKIITVWQDLSLYSSNALVSVDLFRWKSVVNSLLNIYNLSTKLND